MCSPHSHSTQFPRSQTLDAHIEDFGLILRCIDNSLALPSQALLCLGYHRETMSNEKIGSRHSSRNRLKNQQFRWGRSKLICQLFALPYVAPYWTFSSGDLEVKNLIGLHFLNNHVRWMFQFFHWKAFQLVPTTLLG